MNLTPHQIRNKRSKQDVDFNSLTSNLEKYFSQVYNTLSSLIVTATVNGIEENIVDIISKLLGYYFKHDVHIKIAILNAVSVCAV